MATPQKGDQMMMRYSILTATAGILAGILLGISGAAAGELPTYDMTGFPITPHQMSVLGSSGAIQERAATPALTVDGMPASPLQIAVLSHRPRTAEHQTSLPLEKIGIVVRPE
jgi:hypothetical protein